VSVIVSAFSVGSTAGPSVTLSSFVSLSTDCLLSGSGRAAT
jgi:hypothetical protein